MPLVPKVFGNRGGDQRRFQADERGFVSGRDHQHRAPQSFLAEIAFNELPHFPAPLADQADDIHIGGCVAGDHAQDRAFTDPCPGKDTHALAFPKCQQAVNRPNAKADRLSDPPPGHGIRRGGVDRVLLRARSRDRSEAVGRGTESVQHAPEQKVSGDDLLHVPGRDHFGAGFDAGHFAERHEQHPIRLEPDDFRFHRGGVAARMAYLADFPDLRGWGRCFPPPARSPVSPNRWRGRYPGAEQCCDIWQGQSSQSFPL